MDFSQLTKSIQTAAESVPDLTVSDETRLGLLQAIGQLKASIQTPLETTVETVIGDCKLIVLRLGIDLGIFNAFAGKSDVSLATLAAVKGADEQLVFRVMRFLTGMGMFEARSANSWSPKPLAAAYVDGSPLRDAIYHYSVVGKALRSVPSYFEQTHYTQTSDAFRSPWQYATGTKELFFEWLKSHPEDQAAFNRLMSLARLGLKENWFDFYPASEKLVTQAQAKQPLLIDIGGGLGHDLKDFHKAYPSLPGKLIVQDLPGVIDQAMDQLPSGIEGMKYDFFTPQPIRGARAYYLRSVLHDWPEKQALQILANIHAAMESQSILLLNETVMPDGPNIPLYTSMLDLTMMAMFNSLERTEQQWLDLLDQAGFETIKVWKPKVMVQGAGVLFEAKLKEAK